VAVLGTWWAMPSSSCCLSSCPCCDGLAAWHLGRLGLQSNSLAVPDGFSALALAAASAADNAIVYTAAPGPSFTAEFTGTLIASGGAGTLPSLDGTDGTLVSCLLSRWDSPCPCLWPVCLRLHLSWVVTGGWCLGYVCGALNVLSAVFAPIRLGPSVSLVSVAFFAMFAPWARTRQPTTTTLACPAPISPPRLPTRRRV
jgi:hypothetical protein